MQVVQPAQLGVSRPGLLVSEALQYADCAFLNEQEKARAVLQALQVRVYIPKEETVTFQPNSCRGNHEVDEESNSREIRLLNNRDRKLIAQRSENGMVAAQQEIHYLASDVIHLSSVRIA